jgi:hypothetical protein
MIGQGRTGQDRTGQDRTGQDRTGQDRTVEEMKNDRRRVVHTSDESKERFHNFLSPSRVSCPVAHLHVDVQVIVP